MHAPPIWATKIQKFTLLCVVIGFPTLSPVLAQTGDPCLPSPAGLVGWWPGDGNANDLAGSNNGNLLGSASFEVGKVGQTFAFHGGEDAVKIAATSGLDVGAGGGLSIEVWIRPRDLSIRSPLVEWNRGGTNFIEWGVHLFVLQPGDFGLGGGSLFANLAEADGTPHYIISAAGIIEPDVWQHVAVTYDKSSGITRLYRNGEIVAEVNFTNISPATSYDLFLGRRPAGDGTQSYVGLLDEVSIFNRALAQSEIQAIYTAGTAGKCQRPTGLDGLISMVKSSDIPRNRQPLLASLLAARASFHRGNIKAAINQLRAFQRKVRAQVAPKNPSLAALLIGAAQEIIDEGDPSGVVRAASAISSGVIKSG